MFVLGCGLSYIRRDYSSLPIQTLEEKAAQGDLQAVFWLGDRYFLGKGVPQDKQKAFAQWDTVLSAVEKEPAVISQRWFKEAYQQHHPIAVSIEMFNWSVGARNDANAFDKNSLPHVGRRVDNFLLAREKYPQYHDFFVGLEEAVQSMGKASYIIGQRSYDAGERQDAYSWADRACKLNYKDGCVLALKTF